MHSYYKIRHKLKTVNSINAETDEAAKNLREAVKKNDIETFVKILSKYPNCKDISDNKVSI